MPLDFSRTVLDPIRSFLAVRNQEGTIQVDATQADVSAKWPGLFRGIARNVQDPEQRLRVSVSVPDVLGNAETWAEACVAPQSRPIPKVGQEVWVMFEQGNVDLPVWLGVNGAQE